MGAASEPSGQVERLEALVAQLLDRVATLEQGAHDPTAQGEVRGVERRAAAPVSRRRLLVGAAGVTAAGMAATIAAATPAAANSQGGSWTLGDGSNTATSFTGLTAPIGGPALNVTNSTTGPGFGVLARLGDDSGISAIGAGLLGDSHAYPGVYGTSATGYGVVGVTGAPSGRGGVLGGVAGDSASAAGVAGSSNSNSGVFGTSGTGNGVYGRTGVSGFSGVAGTLGESSANYGVAGFSASRAGVRAASGSAEGIRASSNSGVGAQCSGGRAAINLVPRSTAGRPTSGSHQSGDLVVDSAGALFLCTVSGNPGTWVRVTVTAA